MWHGLRNMPCSSPVVISVASVCDHLFRVTQDLNASCVLLDSVKRPIELGGFAVRVKDIGPHEIRDSTLTIVSTWCC